jgi:hypothetical protein
MLATSAIGGQLDAHAVKESWSRQQASGGLAAEVVRDAFAGKAGCDLQVVARCSVDDSTCQRILSTW